MNSQTLLETSAEFWILVAWTLLIHYVSRRASTRRVQGSTILLTGLAFGIALLTKEKVALVSLLPLLVCFITNWFLPRTMSALTAVTALTTYALYPLTVAIIGDWQPFVEAKFSGLARFVGAVKITGIKREGGPSLFDALAANFADYGTAYLLMLSGVLALFVLARQNSKAARLLALWLISAYAMLSFSVVFGTLEEQFFYYLIIPALIATAVGFTFWLGATEVRWKRQALKLCFGLLSVLFLGWTSTIWYDVHFTATNASEALQAYLRQNVPLNSRISTTTEESQFLTTGYRTGVWTTPKVLQLNQARYVILSTKQTANGYGFAKPPLEKWLDQHGSLAFSTPSRVYGSLNLYRLPQKRRLEQASRVAPSNSNSLGAAKEGVIPSLKNSDNILSKELVGSRARASRLTNQLRSLAAVPLSSRGEASQKDLQATRLELQVTQDSIARLSNATGTYKVRSGDSLSRIALAYYSNANRWPEIAKANAFLSDPNRLTVDMVLVIP